MCYTMIMKKKTVYSIYKLPLPTRPMESHTIFGVSSPLAPSLKNNPKNKVIKITV